FAPLLVLVLLYAAGCGPSISSKAGRTQSQSPGQAATRATTPAATPARAEDPVLALIAESDRHFTTGQKELELGHAEGPKQEFNRAVTVLLESSYGARTEPRLREHFDRLIDRISAYEVKALAEGDGFTEKKYETASIDELLALSTTFGTPNATPEVKEAVQSDLKTAGHDIPIPLNQRVLSYVELFQGRLHDFID